MSTVSQLAVDLRLNSARFEAGMKNSAVAMRRLEYQAKQTQKSVSKMEAGFGRAARAAKQFIAAAVVAAVAQGLRGVVGAARDLADELDALSKTASSLDFDFEALQEWQFAADLAGISAKQLDTGLNRLLRNMSAADRGTGIAAERLEEFGISVRNAEGDMKSVEDLLPELANKFAGMTDDTEKAQIALDLFGKQGPLMAQFLSQGTDEIERLSGVAKKFGLIVDEDTAKGMEEFNDRMSVMSQIIRAQVRPLLIAIIPVIEGVSKFFLRAAVNIRKFTGDLIEFSKTSVGIKAVAAAVAVLSAALLKLSLSNPFTAFALVAVVAAGWVITNWEKVKVLFSSGLAIGWNLAVAAYQNFKATMLNITADITQGIRTAWAGTINFIIDKLNALIGAFKNWAKSFEGTATGGFLAEQLGISSDDITTLTKLNVQSEAANKLKRQATDASNDAADASTRATNALIEQEDALTRIEEEQRLGLKTANEFAAAQAALASEYEEVTDAASKAGGAAKKAAEDSRASFITLGEALTQVGDKAKENVGDKLIGSIFDMTDALIDGEFSFKKFARSLLKDIAKITTRAVVMNALLGLFNGGSGSSSSIYAMLANAAGVQTSLTKHAKGGVVNSPTTFPMTGGMGLMGEAGPEAIIPLSRGADGSLGVGASPVVVNITNNTSSQVEVQNSREGEIEVIISAVESRFANSMSTGQGAFARGIESGYRTRRKSF